MAATIEAKTLFVALLVGLAHLVSGIAALVQSAVLSVTPLAGIVALSHVWGAGYGEGTIGAILVVAGLMAIIGATFRSPHRAGHLVLLFPQQALLILQIFTIAAALLSGHYPDGYVPAGGSWFILADQIWAFVLAVSHSIWLAAFLYGSRDDGIAGAR